VVPVEVIKGLAKVFDECIDYVVNIDLDIFEDLIS
jgi:hypothetical protein